MNSGASGDDQSTVQASELIPLALHPYSSVSPSLSFQEGPPNPPPRIPDHDLLRCIGRGAYGEVWLARNVFGQFRAVKLVYRNKFEHERPYEREFEGIRKFEPISRGHESQVDILHVGRDDQGGYFYYVMELADDAGPENAKVEKAPDQANVSRGTNAGLTLAPESYTPHTLKLDLHRQNRLPVDMCIEIGLALTTALQHLHDHGLLHRDIKPSNIIFMKGVPKLGDIGLVASMDATMSFVGTPGFLPPEGPGTPQGDIYSLGKVLYEMCMGRDRQEFPKLPANLGEFDNPQRLLELNAIILKACHTDPGQRYESAREMGAELELLQGGKSVRYRRAVHQRWNVAKKLALVASAAALLIVGTLFVQKARQGHIPNPEAMRFYKLGQWHYSRLTPNAHATALTNLTLAVEKDPKFIQPYAELTALYTWNQLPGVTNEQIRLQRVQELADKASAIDPDAAETHTAKSWCRFLERDWRGAEKEIQRAIQVNSNLAIARDVYCFYLSMQGRSEEARREGERATEMEPPDSRRVSAIIASWPYVAERRFDLAIAQLQRVLDLDPNFAWGHSYLGDCYEAQSNYVAAMQEYRTAYSQTATDKAKINKVFDAIAKAYAADGERGYLSKWVELILADLDLPEEERLLSEVDNANLAGYYARLGEKEKALKELETHFDEPQVWHQLKFIALYDPLHDQPRFKALLKRAGLSE